MLLEQIHNNNWKVFEISNMRENEDRDNYMESLYYFVHAFYKESDIKHLIRNRMISDILTPTDEAFLLLCIMVYFKEFTNCKNHIGDKEVSLINFNILNDIDQYCG